VTLEELADACEGATGPSRELDCAIARELKRDCYPAPCFGSSLDAAMTLVDHDVFFHVSRFSPGNGPCEAHVYPNRCLGDDYEATGATPALALCASALRARAATQTREG
jgi:hypothetical protein